MERQQGRLEDCLQILVDAGFQPEIATPEFRFPIALEQFKATKNDWASGGHDIYLSPLNSKQMERLSFGYNLNHHMRPDLKLTIMRGSKVGALIRIDESEVSRGGNWYQFTLICNVADSMKGGAINEAPIETYAFEPENRKITKIQD